MTADPDGVRGRSKLFEFERGIHFQIESDLVQPRRILVERRKNHVAELVGRQFHLALARTQ